MNLIQDMRTNTNKLELNPFIKHSKNQGNEINVFKTHIFQVTFKRKIQKHLRNLTYKNI